MELPSIDHLSSLMDFLNTGSSVTSDQMTLVASAQSLLNWSLMPRQVFLKPDRFRVEPGLLFLNHVTLSKNYSLLFSILTPDSNIHNPGSVRQYLVSESHTNLGW